MEIVNLLLDTQSIDVNKQNKAGYTAIMLASLAQCYYGQTASKSFSKDGFRHWETSMARSLSQVRVTSVGPSQKLRRGFGLTGELGFKSISPGVLVTLNFFAPWD